MAKKKKLLSVRPGRYFPVEPEEALPCPLMDCCLHEACRPLKERGFCRQWFFIRRVSSRPLLPSELLQELRSSFGDGKFDFCGVKRDPCLYEILVKAEPSEPVVLPVGLLPKCGVDDCDTSRQKSDSSAWHLQCCWDAFQWDARDWITMLRDTQGKFTIGDMDLVQDFEDGVREALRAEGSVVV